MSNPIAHLFIRFSAVGDLTFGDHPLCVGFGAHSRFRNMPPSYPFEHVQNELREADILFGNLECALSGTGVRANRLSSAQMRGDADLVQALLSASFNIVNLANNHSMHHGKEPFLETVEILRTHDIGYCGLNLGDPQTSQPALIELKGIKVGFLGYSLRPRQHFDYAPLYAEGNPDVMEKEVRTLKSSVDVVVVSLHWGDEFIDRASPQEIALARNIVDSGADLIIGHHPHVLRGIENYKTGVIAYSLGNFVCDMIWLDRLRESLIFSCDIYKNGIRNVRLTPVYINDDYQPVKLDEGKGDALLERIQQLSMGLEQEDLSNLEEKMQKYQKDADHILQVFRQASHRYFLSRMHKYSFPILLQQIGGYVWRRTGL